MFLEFISLNPIRSGPWLTLNSWLFTLSFSKFDLVDAYLQIPIHPDSPAFTTWGLFQYNFLPFALHVLCGIFQFIIDNILSGLRGVMAYQGNVILFGTTKEAHLNNSKKLLERFTEKNVNITPSKCMFGTMDLEFLGFTVCSKGYRPDPNRFKPLVNIESPKDQNHLRLIMGCLQHYSRFIPDFGTRAQPLFVAQSAADWKWTVDCERTLHELIRNITERPFLASFSPSQSITLVKDASEVGIGAVLEQEGLPVFCISRLLNHAEKGYSQTQKKALAVFWAVRRLHKYLFGLHFTIVTDYQALQFLLNPNNTSSRRSTRRRGDRENTSSLDNSNAEDREPPSSAATTSTRSTRRRRPPSHAENPSEPISNVETRSGLRTSEVEPGSPLSYSDMSSVTGGVGEAMSSIRPGVNDEAAVRAVLSQSGPLVPAAGTGGSMETTEGSARSVPQVGFHIFPFCLDK
ncbi:unnamed protein product [Echinostoma caproni]|uniref:RT_RNaseH_2 domain-containing protein n=1 Tax=Echinostoma caproni TaxID=27848 RepID=A0A183B755_9TREM|nr:unnamed protein product [Echinostoma caproni]